MLKEFIAANRAEIISRCRGKVADRAQTGPVLVGVDRGVPVFLDQLLDELSQGPSLSGAITATARQHGHDLLIQGYTVSQVVHDYGDVCQAITGLAVERNAAISNDEFRTLNRCLDDAIAGAVTEFAREHNGPRDAELSELWSLVNSASTAFEALQSGRIGLGGSTGALVRRSLAALRAYVDRQEVTATRAAAAPAAPLLTRAAEVSSRRAGRDPARTPSARSTPRRRRSE